MTRKAAILFEEYFLFYYLFALLFALVSFLDLFFNILIVYAFKNSLDIMFFVLCIVSIIYFRKKKYSKDMFILPIVHLVFLGLFFTYSMIEMIKYITTSSSETGLTQIVSIMYIIDLSLILIFASYAIYRYRHNLEKIKIFPKLFLKLLIIAIILLVNDVVILILANMINTRSLLPPILSAIIELAIIISSIILIIKIVKTMKR